MRSLRRLRSLLCGPGSKRMPGRFPGGGVFCPRGASFVSCSSTSLAWWLSSGSVERRSAARCGARANQLKRTGAGAPVPSAGLSSRHPYAFASESRFQASPVQNLTQPQVEEKDCEARRPHPPTPSEEGRRNLFHLHSVGCLGSGTT